jgi:hypothetical protein
MNFFRRIFSRKKTVPGEEIKKPAVIEYISAPETIKEGDVLKIIVQGHFSNKSWNLDEAVADIKNKDIKIIVIGKKKTGVMSAQALKPYEAVIEVKKLKKGKYKIKAAKGPATVKDLEVK